MQNEPSRPPLSGIGGLPQTSLEAAVNHVLTTYDVVFRPQLAIGDGAAGMLAECLPPALRLAPHPGFGVKLEAMLEDDAIGAAFTSTDVREAPIAAAQRAFLGLLPEDLENRVLKTQLAGPVTILQSLRDAWSRPLWSDERLHAIVANWCARLAEMLALDLEPHAHRRLVVFDEPVLGLPGPRDAAPLVRRVVHQAAEGARRGRAGVGIHCCSEPPLALLLELGVDDWLIDADRHADAIIAGSRMIAAHIEGEGRLTLGLIPPIPHDRRPRTRAILEAIVAAGAFDRRELVSRLALSASCGTMLMPIEREIEILAALAVERDDITTWVEEER